MNGNEPNRMVLQAGAKDEIYEDACANRDQRTCFGVLKSYSTGEIERNWLLGRSDGIPCCWVSGTVESGLSDLEGGIFVRFWVTFQESETIKRLSWNSFFY